MNRPILVTICVLALFQTALVSQIGSGTIETGDLIHRGALEVGDQNRNESGQPRFMDVYPFNVVVGQQVFVTLDSEDFDTYLILESPTGWSIDNDDFGSQGGSFVDLIATEAGTWREPWGRIMDPE